MNFNTVISPLHISRFFSFLPFFHGKNLLSFSLNKYNPALPSFKKAGRDCFFAELFMAHSVNNMRMTVCASVKKQYPATQVVGHCRIFQMNQNSFLRGTPFASLSREPVRSLMKSTNAQMLPPTPVHTVSTILMMPYLV